MRSALFLGHLYPVILASRGGKGVATALGVLLGISPWLALATRHLADHGVRPPLFVLSAIIAVVFAPLYFRSAVASLGGSSPPTL